ncbi:15493_t:CDS:2 [Acaulospora colombiana]|uniref:15493_t:CDS:1 n=1 Tax=Acaulospora colombiana TaxID=27376 RepID=A0ACA9KV46_9GLOM|nr:15493_t:CDS:2 [Acaulospora colombiana]
MGWITRAIERIPPPWSGVPAVFVDQFSKLQIWSYVEFKDGIIYLDSDTIVLKRIDQLFELIKPSTGFEFAAAPDVLWGKDSNNFNAGFMLLKPNKDVYLEIMRAHKIPKGYDIGFAEQAFLNEFFRYRYLRLPETYNINLSIMDLNPHLWKILLPDMNVVHYTIQKPFKNPNPGIYVEPYKLWNSLYKEMDEAMNLSEIESTCEKAGH